MVYAVILAGGSGTRFWPKSRQDKPKQLLNILGPSTMLRQTVERILPLVPYERIIIVAGERLEAAVKEELPELPQENFLLEPVGRNTAPAIGLAAAALQKRDPASIMAVLPADHTIQKQDRLLQVLEQGAAIAKDHGVLITLGITPTHAETGYGYIEQGEPFSDGVFRVARFREKPDRATAEAFLKAGGFSWNSGMFIWKTIDILKAIERFSPRLHRGLVAIDKDLGTARQDETIRQIYGNLDGDSIDYAIMEKSEDILVIPADLGWSDVGCWSALEDVLGEDGEGNIAQGETVLIDTRNSIFYSESRLIAAVGVDDLIVVETGDALLVCRKDKVQDVRKIVDLLKDRGLDHYL
ncbi:MAG: mannose-1-phosphate guanylyltransferase [bacterium]|nr:mannose-1-phosphate guanylyltransferase [bacterium]